MTVANLKIKVPVNFPTSVTGTGGIKVSKSNGIWTIEPDFTALTVIAGSTVTDLNANEIWIYNSTDKTYSVLTLSGLGDALYANQISSTALYKTPALAATTANITLSGPQTIDGISVLNGDRVLVKNQTNPVENGIYVVASGAWTRATDFAVTGGVVNGTSVVVATGTVNASATYIVTSPDPVTIGTDAITFQRYYSSNDLAAHAVVVGGGATTSPVTVPWYFGPNAITNISTDFSAGTYSPNTLYFKDVEGAFIHLNGGGTPTSIGAGLEMSQYSDIAATDGPSLTFHRARGANDSPSIVLNGDVTGVITWDAQGSALLVNSARIRNFITEPTPTNANMGAKLVFECAPNGHTITEVGGNGIYTLTFDPNVGLTWEAGTATALTICDNSGYVNAAPAVNVLDNPAFQIAQLGTSFAVAASTATWVSDRWKTQRTATGMTISQVTGFNGAQYALRMKHTDSSTQSMQVWQQISPYRVAELAGKSLIFSCDALAGATYSGTNVAVTIYTGTNSSEVVTMTGAGIGFATGGANVAASFTPPTGTAARVTTAAMAIPSTATAMAIRISWTPAAATTATDQLDITRCKLEASPTATKYEQQKYTELLDICQMYLETSFAITTVPAQNVGAGTGEYTTIAGKAGAAVDQLGIVKLRYKYKVPAITYYNPAAANAQVRDVTASVDCTSTTAQNITQKGFGTFATGNASTAVGNSLSFHWMADAQL